MSANCDHEFECSVVVAKFRDKPGQGSVEVKGHCTRCGVPLIFQGPCGAGAPFPVASLDRTELRAPVTFGHEPRFSPGPTALYSELKVRDGGKV